MQKKTIVAGIDLGTSKTLVGVWNEIEKQPIIINIDGQDHLPSVVGFKVKDNKAVATHVGQEAINNAVANPRNTVANSKRFLGLTDNDIKLSVAPGESHRILTRKTLEETAAKSYVPTVHNGQIMIELQDTSSKVYVSPSEIAAILLQKCKEAILKYNNLETNADVNIEAVITVPAYFSNQQREAVKNAGTIAGLNVLRIINEPTAAALSRVSQLAGVKHLLVADIGGGTFDVSLLQTDKEGDLTTMEVKMSEGHLALGGTDFNNEIRKWILSQMSAQGISIDNDAEAMARLEEIAEKTKRSLSSMEQATINLSQISNKISAQKTLTLTRSTFNRLIESYLTEIKTLINKVINESKIAKSDMVMLITGGSMYVPAVQSLMKEFGIKLLAGQRVDYDVVEGATIQAGMLASNRTGSSDVLLIDVLSVALGIETLGGINTIIIPANESIPTSATQKFSTAEDNQSTVSINVIQGERTYAKDNRSLGRFDLSGIPPAPRGTPVIAVTFKVDANGIVHVSAREENTGKEAQITLQGNISQEEAKRMREAAEQYKAHDEMIRKNSTLRNEVDNQIYQAKKMVAEHESKLDETLKNDINSQVSELEKNIAEISDIEQMNYEDIEKKSQALSKSMMGIYEQIAKQQQAAQPEQSSEQTEQPEQPSN